MSGERPREAPFEAPSGAAAASEGGSDAGSEADSAARALVPRPSSRKPISGSLASPVASSQIATPAPSSPQGHVIPPPAPLPRVPGLDALIGADAQEGATRRRSRRAVNAGEDIGAATTLPDSSPPDADAFGSSPPPDAFDETLDPLFADADTAPGPLPGAIGQAGDSRAAPGARGFVALAPPLGSPAMPTGASAPAAAPRSAPQEPAQSRPAEDDGVIRPMRIITIGSNADSVEVSARASSRPPPDISPRAQSSPALDPAPPARVGSSPSITTDAEADELDVVDVEEEPVTQPSQVVARAGRVVEIEEEIEEEIEADRITVVDPIEPLPNMPSMGEGRPLKKPPPPPPKRAPGDPGPNSRPSPGQDVASFSAKPAAPTATPDRPSATDSMRKRQKSWWEELFGDDFTRTMDHLDAKAIRKECDFIEDRLGLERGAVMLDLACGPGSHAVELASRGYSVVGYDLSLAMLARAADEAQDRGQKINFLHGDMREMAFEETFDGVYCWSMSFGYFDDEKNLNVLSRIHRALRKGGMLLLDVTNRDYVAPRQPSLVWFEGDGCVCMDEMHVDFFSSRLRVKRTVMFEDGRSKEVDYSIRIYALHELGKMLHECGFKVVEVTGHQAHPGVFFGAESPRIIILAERD